MGKLILSILKLFFVSITVFTSFFVLLMTLASIKLEGNTRRNNSGSFSVICAIRNEEEVLSTAEELLRVNDVEEFIISDDSSNNEEGLEKYLDNRLKWFKRPGSPEKNQKHISLNTALEKVSNKNLIVMDIDSSVLAKDVTEYYNGGGFTAAKVPPEEHSTLFGLYEKLDAQLRQSVFQPGRYKLSLCPNLPGCFYFADLDVLEKFGYKSSYEDFFLTLDIYQSGRQVEFVNREVALQDIPESLSGVLERRKRWFNHFWSNSLSIFLKILKMPDMRTGIGLALYPLIWYIGFYSLLVAAIISLSQNSGILLLFVASLFYTSYGIAVYSSQKSNGLKALAVSIYYLFFYSTSLIFIPFYSFYHRFRNLVL